MERRIDINSINQQDKETQIQSVIEIFKPNFEKLTDENGVKCLPVDIVDWQTEKLLMQGYMNLEAFIETILTGNTTVTFWSRSRAELWPKGLTSGSFLIVKAITTDCDQDTFKIYAQPTGPVCHTGSETCYDNSPVLYFDPNYQIPDRRIR